MTITVAQDQVNLIVYNQHHDPFEVLGPHLIEQDDKSIWAIRAYLPTASQAWVIVPKERKQYEMTSTHHPNFFECQIETKQDLSSNYQIKFKEGEHERVIYDPYSFRSPKLTDLDVHLFAEGNHHRIYEKLGAHVTEVDGVKGVYFAVWAPNARNASILGDFNYWDGRKHQMAKRNHGIWELFIPDIGVGEHYKYEIKNWDGHIYEKSDPYGFQQEVRPKTASIVTDLDSYQWHDEDWLERRRNADPLKQPMAVYECHLGSWLHASSSEPSVLPDGTTEPVVITSDLNTGARFLTYRELAAKLIPYVKDLGFTHIELLPVAEHPFDGSWGYQVTGYYAATSRFGTPEDFMYFVDQCHANDIGVIVDWVPGHFPKDGHGLAFFDGTHLYEHADPRKGEHKEWGTLVFNYGRNEVRNFLVANALFWVDKYHIDGFRVDAVASMLYLNYLRKDGEWVANEYGGCEHIEAADFLRQYNHVLFSYYPGVLSIAEESTSWPMVTWPTYVGGLGFNFKWNMGWMHDTLDYFHFDPWFRQFHQNNLTFSIWYFHSENYMLALSHDEVVHGKSPLIGKMHGDRWQKFASVRALFAYMYAHPGKKTLFMSMEFAQWTEWNVWSDLDWSLLQFEDHQKMLKFMTNLNTLYKNEPALYTRDYGHGGFEWIDCTDNQNSVVSFIRWADTKEGEPGEFIVAVGNFTAIPQTNYRIGVPEHGFYTELFNSDSGEYGGGNMGNLGGKWSDEWGCHERPCSIELCLPPLSIVMLKLDREKTAAAYAPMVIAEAETES
jgi:1,4-alpha-glucan branching enzyme